MAASHDLLGFQCLVSHYLFNGAQCSMPLLLLLTEAWIAMLTKEPAGTQNSSKCALQVRQFLASSS